MTRSVRLPARDRLWLGVHTVVLTSVHSPADEPLTEAVLRARLVELATTIPSNPLFRQSVPGRPDRYRETADPAEAVRRAQALAVVRIEATGELDAAAAVQRELRSAATGGRQSLTPRPRVLLGDGVVGLCWPHAWGDGMTVLELVRVLLSGPAPAGASWTRSAPGARRPLLAALRHRFAHAPGDAWSVVRSVRAGRQPHAARPGGLVQSAGRRAAAGTVVRSVTVGRPALAELKRWRREGAPGASVTALMMAATARALRDEGIGRSPGFIVACDDRAYLPRGAGAQGNMIGVIRLGPPDDTDASAVHEALRGDLASGRPLLSLAASAGRETLRHPIRGPRSGRPVAAAVGPLVLACSTMRVDRILPRALLAGPDEPITFVAATTATNADCVALLIVDLGVQLHLTVTADASAVDLEALERALAALAG